MLERDIGCIRTAASILGRSFAEEDGYPFHSTRICSVNQFRLEASPAIFSYVSSFDVCLLNECDAFTRNLLRLYMLCLYETVNLTTLKLKQMCFFLMALFSTLRIIMMTFLKIFLFIYFATHTKIF